jgi:hypothetical protein
MTKKEELYNAIGLLTGGELLEALSDEQLDDLWKSVAKENCARNEKNLEKVTQKQLDSVYKKAIKVKTLQYNYEEGRRVVNDYVKELADKYDTCEYDIFIKAGVKEGYI